MTMIENAANSKANNTNAEKIALIKVDNLRFRRYELVGVLTEIRLVLSADVTYDTYQNGQPVTLTNPIQVERSYQYNEASVSTDDQQGDQIRDWLYDSLARRITDQYVAISLPKVAPNTSKARQTAPMLEHSAPSTTVVTTPTS
jgi:LPS-assembly lipoprotein